MRRRSWASRLGYIAAVPMIAVGSTMFCPVFYSVGPGILAASTVLSVGCGTLGCLGAHWVRRGRLARGALCLFIPGGILAGLLIYLLIDLVLSAWPIGVTGYLISYLVILGGPALLLLSAAGLAFSAARPLDRGSS